MRHTARFSLFLIFVCLFTISPNLLALSSSEKVAFKNLGPVAVLVEELDPDGRIGGITKNELQAFVELKLRQNGIPFSESYFQSKENPYLYVNVNIIYLKEIDHFIYSASLALKQRVQLLRSNDTVSAETWNHGVVAITQRHTAKNDVKDTIEGVLTIFMNTYLSANP